MRDIKTIAWSSPRVRGKILHIELPNGIINIYAGLHDQHGRSVDVIEMIGDENRSDEHRVLQVGGRYKVRLIRCKGTRRRKDRKA